MDLASLSVIRYDREGKVADAARWENFERNQLFLDELRHFLDCVESRRKPVADLEDGVWSLKMALAARESIASRGVIDLLNRPGSVQHA